MSDLLSKKCQACEGGAAPLSPDAVDDLLQQLPGWELAIKEIRRTFRFKNYHEVMAFVNATAWISHTENHHPDLDVHYNQVTVHYSTHAVDGLTENDFICAAKVNALL